MGPACNAPRLSLLPAYPRRDTVCAVLRPLPQRIACLAPGPDAPCFRRPLCERPSLCDIVHSVFSDCPSACDTGFHYDGSTTHCEVNCSYCTTAFGNCCGDVGQVSCAGLGGNRWGGFTYVGIVLSDFPGHGLIDAIIAVNTAGNTPPEARCKNVSVDADASCTATASIDDGSNDPDGHTPTCVQAPAGPYGVGTTAVTLTCTDSSGATDSCTSNVHAPPTLACPASVDVECSGNQSATASFTGRRQRTTRNKDEGRGTPQGAPISPLLSTPGRKCADVSKPRSP
jgi:hypothetical protein